MKGLTLEESVTDGVKDERGRKGTRVPKRALGSGGGAGSLRFGPRAGGSRGAPNHRPPRTACGAGPTPLYGGSLRGPSPPPLALVRRRPPSFATFGIFPEPLRRGRAELLRRNARLGRQGEEGSRVGLRPALRTCARGAARGPRGRPARGLPRALPPGAGLSSLALRPQETSYCPLLPSFHRPPLQLLYTGGGGARLGRRLWMDWRGKWPKSGPVVSR